MGVRVRFPPPALKEVIKMTLYKWKDISSFGLFPNPGDESEFLPHELEGNICR